MRKIIRDRILEKYNYKCVNCGSIKNLEVDHIIPLSRGGKENEDNMQVLCKKCNRKKSNRIDFRQFFIIGEHPKYIFMKRNFPFGAFPADEFKKILELMFEENESLW